MKNIYRFGYQKTDGSVNLVDLLGGKGANLAEMTNLGIPVPPGFTITTKMCQTYLKNNNFTKKIYKEFNKEIGLVESILNKGFGSEKNPLLFSVRSGAKVSMPGMMETVLNIGLTSKTIPGLISKTKNERFVYDSYRRLIMMYADVVLEKADKRTTKSGLSIRLMMEKLFSSLKKRRGYKNDSDINVIDLKKISDKFKKVIKQELSIDFPDNHMDQLVGSIQAVFKSWNGERAIKYRKIEGINHKLFTAANVQAMVFGNMDEGSATGVAFTRNPSTGDSNFYGEWLPNAQGEDVVAGIRTPHPINKNSRTSMTKHAITLENEFPSIYNQLITIKNKLEKHFKDMQDIEFTIENKKLWMLQTRKGKRNGMAAIRIALDLYKEKLIDVQSVFNRVNSKHLNEIMHPMIDPVIEQQMKPIATGLPAGPGTASGRVVFSASEAENIAKKGRKVILVRKETSPEDINGMNVSEAILTTRGGMTSHAALVARGWGKCCIVGCNDLVIDEKNKKIYIDNLVVSEGEWLTLNGSEGKVYGGKVKLIKRDVSNNTYFKKLMLLSDKNRNLKVRTNAEQSKDVLKAVEFGSEGIGLCRTEHMFFNPKRIQFVRLMILAQNEQDRKKILLKLLPYQQNDFYKIMKNISPFPVTIRLLDPPLHEFLDLKKQDIVELAEITGLSKQQIKNQTDLLHEVNPMLGHRGCRLGVSYPEITKMQATAIIKASIKLLNEGITVFPEIMVPLVGSINEFINQKNIITEIFQDALKKEKVKIKYLIGTMIELPRACIIADKIAEHADFISFGTNDLTQTCFGFSRDDIGSFLPHYLNKKILTKDPFESLDVDGVGSLINIAVKKARKVNKKIKIGVCGEHGGDEKSIYFFNQKDFDYVSCSPYRVPIARLAAAKAKHLKL